jgi:hypothetical protein
MTWLHWQYSAIAASIAIPALLILYFLKLRRRDVEVSTTLLWKKAVEDLQANAPFQKLRRNILLLLQLLALAAALLALGQPQMQGSTPLGRKNVILLDRSASMSAIDGDARPGTTTTRLEAAKKKAIELVDSLREPGLFDKDVADEAMVIAFDSSADVRQTFTSDKTVLKAAIDAVEPTDGPTLYDEAFRLAKAHAPRRMLIENGRATPMEGLYSPAGAITIHLFSDGRAADASKVAVATDDSVIYHAIGSTTAPNLGVVSLRSERAFDNPSKLSVFVGLENTDRIERTADIEFVIDGIVAGIRSVTLPPSKAENQAKEETPKPAPGTAPSTTEATDAQPAPPPSPSSSAAPDIVYQPGSGGVVFQADRAEGGVITVRLTSKSGGAALGDMLPTDDTGWLVVPPAKRLNIAIVSQGAATTRDLLMTILEGLPLAKPPEVLAPADFQQQLAGGKATPYDVVILDGWLPESPKPAASPAQAAAGATTGAPDAGPLPPGRYLILNAVPASKAITVKSGPSQDSSVIINWSRQHPAMRSVKLDALVISKSPVLELDESAGAIPLATSDVGPAIIELTTPEAHALVVPFDIAQSNWPFDVSFVLFLASGINYLGDDSAGGGAGAAGGASGGPGSARLIQPGGVLTDRIPMSVHEARVTTPDGTRADIAPAPDGRIVYGPIRKSGVYTLSWDGQPGPSDPIVSGRPVRAFAANLCDATESNIATSDHLALASRIVAAEQTGEGKSTRKLWPWLLLAALLVILFEWFIYNRKVHI